MTNLTSSFEWDPEPWDQGGPNVQEGIYFEQGQRPKSHYAVAFVAARPGATGPEVGEELQQLWHRLQALKAGDDPELPGHPVPSGELDTLLAYGPKAFTLPKAPARVPPELAARHRFLSPRTSGGGSLLHGSGLAYDGDVRKNVATEEIAIQFTAQTALAVRRAVVHLWKATKDESLPISLAAFFLGFQRDDGRSWLGFHDGVSNMAAGEERHECIRIKTGAYRGGSTMVFARLAVDLSLWDGLSLQEQELLVGRKKLSGCALVSASGTVAGCPEEGTLEITEPGNERFREPPLATDPAVRRSHVQRANLAHNQSTGDPTSLRVFRQGYEFLETTESSPGFRAGLNFVSFQDTPKRVISMLTREGWLGRTNFGGSTDGDGDSRRILGVRAAGIYLVPPIVEGEEFPGSSILG